MDLCRRYWMVLRKTSYRSSRESAIECTLVSLHDAPHLIPVTGGSSGGDSENSKLSPISMPVSDSRRVCKNNFQNKRVLLLPYKDTNTASRKQASFCCLLPVSNSSCRNQQASVMKPAMNQQASILLQRRSSSTVIQAPS